MTTTYRMHAVYHVIRYVVNGQRIMDDSTCTMEPRTRAVDTGPRSMRMTDVKLDARSLGYGPQCVEHVTMHATHVRRPTTLIRRTVDETKLGNT